MSAHTFTSGERVLVKVRVGRKEKEIVGIFQVMQTKSRAVVWVDPEALDDATDGMRLVEKRSVKPYYNHPTDQQRRARHAARLYRQGVRVFNLEKPDGRTFYVETLDLEQQVAVGRQVKRKTVQIVPLHSLWPELR